MTVLFRESAIAHVADRRFGTVMLAQPASYTALTIFFLVIASGIIAFLACFSVTRKVQISGMLLPSKGMIRVQSPQGTITDIRAIEGQSVRRGDILFVVVNERFNAKQGDTDQALNRLLLFRRASLDADLNRQLLQSHLRMKALQERVENLRKDARRIGEQITLQQRRVEIASDFVARQAELRIANFVSAASLQDRQAELIDQQQRLADLGRAQSASIRDLASVQADLTELQLQTQRDREVAARAIAAIDQELAENEAHREAAVRAPQDGTVTSVSAALGGSVGPGQTLAAVLPADSDLQAELYAPSRAAGFIKPGMTVLLRFQAFPYQKFGQYRAEVSEVSRGPMQATDLVLPTVANGASTEPVYRIRARLMAQSVRAYGQEQQLKPGMAIDASVLLEERHLYEWILEPLYSISGQL